MSRQQNVHINFILAIKKQNSTLQTAKHHSPHITRRSRTCREVKHKYHKHEINPDRTKTQVNFKCIVPKTDSNFGKYDLIVGKS